VDTASSRRDEQTAGTLPSPAPLTRRLLAAEVILVFAVSLGADGVRALVSFIGDLTASARLADQQALLVGSRAPGRPWLDLAMQLTAIVLSLAPVALGLHFLYRSRESARTIGLDLRRPRGDLLVGASLAAVVGGTGLGFYLLAHAAGVNLTVVPESLPAVWWRMPVLLLSAFQNGLLEEVLVAGYLLHRLRQLGWSDNRALAVSATLRGSYHLYQGLGGFVGNLVMGLLFGRIYQRWGRTTPLVVAHTLIDAVAFVGYAALVGHVSWLP
jgi:membrane protease YdiL (CAAX protease family)